MRALAVNTRVFKEMIDVIRIEQERRSARLHDLYDIHPDLPYDQWFSTDEPFLNELCLMLLVTLGHQIERGLLGLAARAGQDSEEISRQQYEENIKKFRKGIGWNWQEIRQRLKLKEEPESIIVLRFLSNCYKHDPSFLPDEELLNSLSLPTGVNYARLPESDDLREGLAKFIGLYGNADYCDIADKFIEIAADFLKEVESQANLSKFNWVVSIDPDDAAR